MSAFRDKTLVVHSRPSSELIARVRELRRRAPAPTVSKPPEDRSLERQVHDLRTQVAHLEALVQGLQDSTYREVRRHDEQITELQESLEPTAIAAALSKDARDRGL